MEAIKGAELPRYGKLSQPDCESDDGSGFGEAEVFLERKTIPESTSKKNLWRISARVCTLLNICLFILLSITLISIYPRHCIKGPAPPYSPLWEDGVVRYVNTRIRPQKIFQSETSDEVERAWNSTLGSSDGLIQLPTDKTSKLPRTVESWARDGYLVYGVSVFHQLHCLNRIRKTFYADEFFAHESQEEITFHKNHCFDLLRQTIMCNGDVSLVSWWNKNFTYTDNHGKVRYTEEYLSKSKKERVADSVVFWDVETRCHDFDAINQWVEEHRFGL